MDGVKVSITALLLALSLVCAAECVCAEEISRLNRSNRTLLGSVYGVEARVEGVSNASETPEPTSTPEPTITPEPTYTPEPTHAPAPQPLWGRLIYWIRSLFGFG